jgi:broad specificity phosphatase PhoE
VGSSPPVDRHDANWPHNYLISADRHPDDRILVVAHSTAIRLALCALIGVPLGDYRRVFPQLRNCGLTELRLTGALCRGVRPDRRGRPVERIG